MEGKGSMNIQVGDQLRLKKQHPCGSNWWEVLRIGADIKIKCMGCGHLVMLPRVIIEKNTKEIKKILEK